MRTSSIRIATIVLGATVALAACSSAATVSTPSGGASPTATDSAATDSPAATVQPSTAAVTDLSGLEGDWIASIQDVRVNFTAGDYDGATVTVNGGRIRVSANGGDTASELTTKVGPTPITKCQPATCQVQVGDALPSLISVLPDGTVALLDIATLEQLDAGAGTCGAPAVDGAGVVTISADANTITFVNGIAGGFGVGSGTDPCAGAAYQVVWTHVLTRAP